jgi:kynurenine formamidase
MYIDLTQTLVDKMMVFPGDETPKLEQTHTFFKNLYCNYRIESGLHVGTHIDGPMHMTNSSTLLSDIEVNNFVGKACVIDASKTDNILWDDNYIDPIKKSEIVLFYTGHARYFGTEKYLSHYPAVEIAFAERLVKYGIKMIGIDTLSPDYLPHPVHKILLGNGILIAENLKNLDKLLSYKEFEVIALPLKTASDSAPARIIARIIK